MNNACSNILSANPSDVILFVLAIVVLIVLIGCIWAFFYAIFMFIFSKWDDAKVKSAWNSIRYMIIGLFLTVMLLFMWPTILKLFRMSNTEEYTAKSIFVKIGSIVSCVCFWVAAVVTNYPNTNPFWSNANPFGLGSPAGTTTSSWLTIYEL